MGGQEWKLGGYLNKNMCETVFVNVLYIYISINPFLCRNTNLQCDVTRKWAFGGS
jgi:hypothetical protein